LGFVKYKKAFKPYEKGFFELDTLRTTQLFQELVTLDC